MTSSNGNSFRVNDSLCGEFTGPDDFPAQRPVTRSLDVFFDLRPNKRLCKQSWGWWFETPPWSLWGLCNAISKLFVYWPFVRRQTVAPTYAIIQTNDVLGCISSSSKIGYRETSFSKRKLNENFLKIWIAKSPASSHHDKWHNTINSLRLGDANMCVSERRWSLIQLLSCCLCGKCYMWIYKLLKPIWNYNKSLSAKWSDRNKLDRNAYRCTNMFMKMYLKLLPGTLMPSEPTY